jgi:hypothetical protein
MTRRLLPCTAAMDMMDARRSSEVLIADEFGSVCPVKTGARSLQLHGWRISRGYVLLRRDDLLPPESPRFAAVSRMDTRLVYGPVQTRSAPPKPTGVDHPRCLAGAHDKFGIMPCLLLSSNVLTEVVRSWYQNTLCRCKLSPPPRHQPPRMTSSLMTDGGPGAVRMSVISYLLFETSY